jgi:membrane-associated phospholipid phosphatase
MPRASRSVADRLLGAAVLMVVLAALSYALCDRAVADWAFHLSRFWANNARRLSGLGEGMYWLVVVSVIGLTAFLRKKHDLALRAGKTAVAIAAAGLAANALKVVAGRARPRALDEGVFGFHFFELGYRFNSFPSGHAAIAAAVASAICFARPTAWPAAALLWLLLAGGRVLTGSHFVSDVLAGGAVGIAVMVVVERSGWLDRLLHRFRKAEARPPQRDDAGETSRADA